MSIGKKTNPQSAPAPVKLSRKEQKELEAALKRAKRDDRVPRTAQQSIPFQRMFPDGICRVTERYYTKTIQFQDINYQLAQQEDKTAIFEEWCSFLNFFDSSIHFELSFMNMSTDADAFEKSIRIPFQDDGFDDVRAEYGMMLRQQLQKGNNGLTKTKYLTFGIEADTMKQAKPRLDHIEVDLMNNFHRLGVSARLLNGKERLQLMHSMFHMGDQEKFHFDWKDLPKSGLSVKDYIAPTSFAFPGSRTFRMGKLYGAMSYLQITASDISDQLLKDFLDMDSSEIVTMHIQSVDQNKAIKQIKHTITELDRSKMPQDYIDQFLRYGSNTENQRTQIVIEFSKQKPAEQLIPFLKKTYHGGYGMSFDGTKVSAWYSDEGMRIAYGNTARYARNAQVVTWEAMAGRIDVLLEQGQFATNTELAENRNFETKQLAKQLWHMAHDMSKPAADAGYMDIVHSLPGGFPEGTERLTSLLPEFYPFILEQVAAFRNAYLSDRSLMRFPMYNPQRMLHSLEEYRLPRREFTSTLTELPTERPFITEDEINEHLTKGSDFSGSRDRIYTFYQASRTGKEKQDFLKNEYGIGGGNNALSGNFHSSVFTDGRGIRLEKPNCTRIEIPWTKVVKYYGKTSPATTISFIRLVKRA